jgi:3-hydroxy-3-methylglutaryl CoA synthase
MTTQYIRKHKDKLADIKLKGRVALLYVGGVGISNSETSEANYKFECSVDNLKNSMVIKGIHAYMMHKYAGILSRNGNDITYANISANTCASSLYSLYEAEGLLDRDVVDYVVIIAEEKTSKDTVRIFNEHSIDLTVGEGFACMVLGRGEGISECKWEYRYNNNPFLVSVDGYAKVATEADMVKGHKTGTVQNDTAEAEAFGDTVGYKDKIGHCQGASGLIEVCMVLEDANMQGRILCVASGLGGFYGSCVVTK